MTPGRDLVTYEGPFGKIGLLICADLTSSVIDQYYNQGIRQFAMGASWTVNGSISTFARIAKENNSYLLAANHPYYPDSGVINPDGSLQSHIRKTIGLAYGFLPRIH